MAVLKKTVLLCIVMALYILFGAGLFLKFEETPSSLNISMSELVILKEKLTLNYNISKEDLVDIVNTVKNITEIQENSLNWTLYSSMYFTISVVTTIGE